MIFMHKNVMLFVLSFLIKKMHAITFLLRKFNYTHFAFQEIKGNKHTGYISNHFLSLTIIISCNSCENFCIFTRLIFSYVKYKLICNYSCAWNIWFTFYLLHSYFCYALNCVLVLNVLFSLLFPLRMRQMVV